MRRGDGRAGVRAFLHAERDNRVVSVRYDQIGLGYTAVRREDPRIAARLRAALADCRTVLNVGAGAGAYEPVDLDVTAVEPSEVMIAQRPADSAPVVRASAEALPFADSSFDVAIAINTDHHWADRKAGLRELRRVARRRVILLNADPSQAELFWFTRDYLPQLLELIPEPHRQPGYWARELNALLGPIRLEPVPIPKDCRDGFYAAYWSRPHAYLDPQVRAGISVFSAVNPAQVEQSLARLRRDLETGEWHRRNATLLDLEELDLGGRLVVAE